MTYSTSTKRISGDIMNEKLSLIIFTVDRQIEVSECDSIRLNIADDIKGRFSGSYGIKKGHTDTVFSLSAGTVTAYRDNEAIFSAETSDGFGIMENNTLRLTVDSIKEDSERKS